MAWTLPYLVSHTKFRLYHFYKLVTCSDLLSLTAGSESCRRAVSAGLWICIETGKFD